MVYSGTSRPGRGSLPFGGKCPGFRLPGGRTTVAQGFSRWQTDSIISLRDEGPGMPSAFAQNFYQAVRYRADLSHAEMLHHIKGRS